MLLQLYPYVLAGTFPLFNCTVLTIRFTNVSYRTGILSLCDFIRHYYWVYVQLLFSTLARLLSLGTNYRSLQYPIDNTADAMFRKRVRNFKLSFPSDFETLPYTDAQLCVIMF